MTILSTKANLEAWDSTHRVFPNAFGAWAPSTHGLRWPECIQEEGSYQHTWPRMLFEQLSDLASLRLLKLKLYEPLLQRLRK